MQHMQQVIDWISRGLSIWRLTSIFIASLSLLAIYNYSDSICFLRDDFFSEKSGGAVVIAVYLALYSIVDILVQIIKSLFERSSSKKEVQKKIKELERTLYSILLENFVKKQRIFYYQPDDYLVISLQDLGLLRAVRIPDISRDLAFDKWVCVIEDHVWNVLSDRERRKQAAQARANKIRGNQSVLVKLFTIMAKLGKHSDESRVEQDKYNIISDDLISSSPVRRMYKVKEWFESGGFRPGWINDPTSREYQLMKEAEAEDMASPLSLGTKVRVQYRKDSAFNENEAEITSVPTESSGARHYELKLSNDPTKSMAFHVMYITPIDLLKEDA